jgi:hypothetical protein
MLLFQEERQESILASRLTGLGKELERISGRDQVSLFV